MLLGSAWDNAQVQFLGKSLDGHAIEALVVGDLPEKDLGEQDRPLCVFVVGGMHPTEAIASQAALAVVRDLLRDESNGLLKSLRLVVLPSLNPDQQIDLQLPAKTEVRIRLESQIPVDGYRYSPLGLDLNHDYLKLESPEIRSFVSAMDRFQADVVIDLQAGTSVQHGYNLTYDISHHPAKDTRLDRYLRGQLLPEVTGRLTRLNLPVFYTGQFDQARTRWLSLDQSSGSLSQYLTLRGRLGIVCQANPQVSAESRFVATTAFLRETLRRLALDKDHLRPLLVAAQNGSKPGESISLTGMREKAEDVVRVLPSIDKPDAKVFSESKSDGQSDQRPGVVSVQETSVELWNQTSVKSSVALPMAYAIPLRHSWLVSRLESHGIPVAQLKNFAEVQAEVAIVQELKSQPIELGRTRRRLIVQWQKSVETIAAGTFVLQTSGPWGRLIAQLLEPESDECLASWGYLDPYLKKGERYPVVRLNQIPDSVRPFGKIPSSEELSLQNIFEPESALKIAGQHSLSSVAWIESDSDDEYVVERDKRWLAISASSGHVRELVEIKQLVDRLVQIDPTAEEKAWSAVRRTKFWLNSHRYVPLLLLDRLYVYDRTSKQLHDQGAWKSGQDENMLLVSPSPVSDQVALVRDNDLWLLDCNSKQIKRLTHDGSKVRLNGILDWVYQEELYGRGNFTGHWWSPDGRYLAYLQIDQSQVPEYLIVDSAGVSQSIERTRYPKAGQPMASVAVRVIDIAAGNERQIDLGDWTAEDRLIGRVSWSPKNQLVLQVLNRVQNRQELLLIDPEMGRKQSLLKEQTDGFLEIRGTPEFLSNGDFLWLSDLHDGRTHLYRIVPGSGHRQVLTSGPWDVSRILGVSSDESNVYLSGHPGSSVETHLLKLSLSTGQLQRLSKGGGTHDVQFSPAGTYYTDLASDLGNPPKISLYRADGGLVRTVSATANDRHNYLKLQPSRVIDIRARDGLSLPALLMLPDQYDRDRDPALSTTLHQPETVAAKLPVLIHVYGGPQTPLVLDRWQERSYLWHQWLCSQGYAVLLCENRSSHGRGVADTWRVRGNLGAVELQDLEDVVDWVTEQPWADSDRIGLWGWSYGGYLTAYAMTHCNRFKAGIAGAPVTDWRNYDAIYTERYMGLPESNQKGYVSSSVVEAAEQLHGRLMLIHGQRDDNVHLSNTLQLANQLQNAGKQFDLMIYPKERHAVVDPKKRYQMHQMMSEFLDRHLKGSGR
jgi:dipeptidyl aminopeptidase/acylaminoacyl peptidase